MLSSMYIPIVLSVYDIMLNVAGVMFFVPAISAAPISSGSGDAIMNPPITGIA